MLKAKSILKIGMLGGVLATVYTSLAFGGGEVSGGADSYVISPAYFRSGDTTRRISLCYEIASNFGVPENEIESALRWAFEQWDSYIEEKDVHYAVWTGSPGIIGKLGSVKPQCQGTEDLRVYFGVNNGDVAKFRPRFVNPYAFSAITETEQDKKWHKGLLWIAAPGAVDPARGLPKWDKTGTLKFGALKYVLLHEVGHIFGNGHVDHTVMTSSIGQQLLWWTDPAEASASPTARDLQIDQAIELVPNLNLLATFYLASGYGFTEVPGGGRQFPDTRALDKAFERIFGTAPKGQVRGIVKRLENSSRKPHARPDEMRYGIAQIEIEMTDDTGVHRTPITTTALVAEKEDSTPLFNGQHGNHHHSFGASISGFITTASGSRIPVLVNYNMDAMLSVIDLESKNGVDYPLLIGGK